MIALVFVICLVIYAICFWQAFGELEPPRGATSNKSTRSRVDVDEAIVRRERRMS
jgi:hypothetical protein